MDADEFFATCWPKMVPGLRASLARAGASAADREDLVQETAMRLIGMWSKIDWERPVEALARRIALNAFRDQWRRRGASEVLGELPERASSEDTERTAVARLEVREVSQALNSLPANTARILRVAAAESEGLAVGAIAPAVRMARTRARRALAACVKVASAVAAAVAVLGRHAGRAGRYPTAAAVTGMAAVACVLMLGVPNQPASTSKLPAFVTSIARVAPSAANGTLHQGFSVPAGRRLRGTGARLSRHVKRPDKTPYYTINAGPARINTFVDVNLFGHGARISRPQPGSELPACTYGASPSVVVPHC